MSLDTKRKGRDDGVCPHMHAVKKRERNSVIVVHLVYDLAAT